MHVDDLVVAAVAGEDVRAGRVPLGPDAAVRVGSEFEQQLGHVEITPQDGHVQRPHFAAAQIDNLRASREEIAGRLEVAAFGGLVQPGRGDAVDGGLQLGPALEAIGPRQHELRVVKRERLGRGGAVIGLDLRHGFRRRRAVGFEQFLGLSFQLIEVGVLAHGASRRCEAHMSSFPGRASGARAAGARRPL